MSEWFPATSGKLSDVSENVPQLSGKLSDMSEWFPQLPGKLSDVSEWFPQPSGKLSDMSEWFPQLSGKLSDVSEWFPQLSGKLSDMSEWLARKRGKRFLYIICTARDLRDGFFLQERRPRPRGAPPVYNMYSAGLAGWDIFGRYIGRGRRLANCPDGPGQRAPGGISKRELNYTFAANRIIINILKFQ
ncbi:MAG: hypothetical protein LBC81_01435 [Tannerellaceae bacterium]|jgi:hypothetical protein|nr:hypothetical protein [Tannerellaceae bacterium]